MLVEVKLPNSTPLGNRTCGIRKALDLRKIVTPFAQSSKLRILVEIKILCVVVVPQSLAMLAQSPMLMNISPLACSVRWLTKTRNFARQVFSPRRIMRCAAFTMLGVAGLASASSAADQVWKTTGFSDGMWDNATNWVGGAVPGAATGATSADTATFNGGDNLAVTPDATRNIRNIVFDTSAAGPFVFSGGGLVLTSGGAITVNASVINTQTISTNLLLSTAASSTYSLINNSTTNSAQLNIGGNIAGQAAATNEVLTLSGTNGGSVSGVISNTAVAGTGTVGIAKTGTGTWTLSGANSYSGGTSISAGTLVMAHPTALGSVTPVINIGSAAGASLVIRTDGGDNAYKLNQGSGTTSTIASDVATGSVGINHTLGTFSVGANGARINVIRGSNVLSGSPSITIPAMTNGGASNGNTILNPTTADLILGSYTNNSSGFNHNLVLDGTSTGNRINGVIANSGGGFTLEKAGTGTWTLAGANTFGSGVTVSGGILNLQNNNALGSAAKTVTVATQLSEIQLQGGITIPSTITFNTSNNSFADGLVALRNVSGDNTISGTVNISAGPGGSYFASDAGLLTFNGIITATAAARDVVGFTGAGDIAANGVISNGLTVGLPLVKYGTGTLTLAAANTYTGTTTVNEGTVNVTGSLANNSSQQVLMAAPDATAAGNPVLTRRVAAGANAFAGFGSKVTAASLDPLVAPAPGVGLQTAADILLSNTNADTDSLSMSWRTRDVNEAAASNTNAVLSDVLGLAGLDNGADLFVLQLSYTDAALAALNLNENAIATSGELRLGWKSGPNPTDWTTAVNGNLGADGSLAVRNYQGSWATFLGLHPDASSNLENYLGSYGVDQTGNTVWAVLDRNGEFAVIPEPSTLLTSGAALVGLMAIGLRRRRLSAE